MLLIFEIVVFNGIMFCSHLLKEYGKGCELLSNLYLMHIINNVMV